MHTELLKPRRRLYSAAALLIAVAASVSTLAVASPAAAAPSGAGSVIEIVNEHSNLCLDDLGYKTDPGSEVAQWGCNGGAVQLWEITDVGNGYSQIKNRHSNLCLDNFNFGTTPGAEVRQWTCNGNTAQRWRISDAGGGFSEIRNQHSNLCLDNKDWKQNFGAAVHQWTCSGTAVQRWELWDTTIPRVTYAIDRAENPTADQADAYARIDAAVSAAVDRYNALTDINKRLTVWYRPGVRTAEAGLDGGMSFGTDRQYMTEGTALHEMGHTLGVGTSGGYYDKCVNGAWTGTIANNLLQSWDGQGARLNCSNPHIWPYGLNYSSEFSETSFTRNVELTEAMITDGM